MTISRGCNNCKHGPKYLCQFNNNGQFKCFNNNKWESMSDDTVKYKQPNEDMYDQMLNTIIKFTKNGYEVSFHEDPISGLVITFRNRAGARICKIGRASCRERV